MLKNEIQKRIKNVHKVQCTKNEETLNGKLPFFAVIIKFKQEARLTRMTKIHSRQIKIT